MKNAFIIQGSISLFLYNTLMKKFHIFLSGLKTRLSFKNLDKYFMPGHTILQK